MMDCLFVLDYLPLWIILLINSSFASGRLLTTLWLSLTLLLWLRDVCMQVQKCMLWLAS
jgi:hypothetical protein